MESGDVVQWIQKVPWVTLRAAVNEKIIHGMQKGITLGLNLKDPIFIRASYEVDSTVPESTMDCWILEWLEGHRQCRVRSLLSEHGYWRIVKTRKKKKDKGNQPLYDMLLEEYPCTDDEGPYIKVEETIIRPSVFYVAFTQANIAFQHIKTKLWLSVEQNGAITGLEKYEDSCLFDIGIKAALSSKYKHKRYFYHTPLLSKYITQDSWWIRRKQTFFIFFRGTHVIVYSAGTGKYWNIDKKNRLETSEIPARVQFRGGEPYWEFYIDIAGESLPANYVQLLQSPTDKVVCLANEIKPEEVQLAIEKSRFEISILPSSKGKDLKISQSQVNVEEQKELFGTCLDDIPDDLCGDDGVPFFLVEAIDFISKHLNSEGLFRISGSTDRIKQLRLMLNSGLSLEESIIEINSRDGSKVNVDDICGILKNFFRDLPKPLIPDDIVDILIKDPEDKSIIHTTCGPENFAVYRETQLNVKSVVNRKLTKSRRAILNTLCQFLHSVAEHSEKNKMTPHNLALVFAPNMASGDRSLSNNWKEIVAVMIACYHFVFSGPVTTRLPQSSLNIKPLLKDKQ